MTTARMIWEEMKPQGASLSDMVRRLQEIVTDPTENNYALAGLLKLSREASDAFLHATDVDHTKVVAEMNRVLDAQHGLSLERPETDFEDDAG